MSRRGRPTRGEVILAVSSAIRAIPHRERCSFPDVLECTCDVGARLQKISSDILEIVSSVLPEDRQ